MEGVQNKFLFSVSFFIVFQAIIKAKNMLTSNQYLNQDLFHERFNIKTGESGVCGIEWRTDARDLPNLTLQRA